MPDDKQNTGSNENNPTGGGAGNNSDEEKKKRDRKRRLEEAAKMWQRINDPKRNDENKKKGGKKDSDEKKSVGEDSGFSGPGVGEPEVLTPEIRPRRSPEESSKDSDSDNKSKISSGNESEKTKKSSEEVIDSESTRVEPAKAEVIDVGNSIPGHVEPRATEGVNYPIEENFGEEFWDILEQAGISKRGFAWFVVIIILIIVGIVFFLFGGLDMFSDGGADEVDNIEEIIETSDENLRDKADLGVIPSYIFGLEFTQNTEDFVPLGRLGSDAGLVSAFIFGESFDPTKEDIVYYFEVLRKLQNTYEVDIYEMLDNSVDRRLTLNSYISELDELIIESERIYDEINRKMDILNDEFSLVTADQDFYEESFFQSVDDLTGQNAYDFLLLFVESGQAAFELRSLFNTYGTISDMYLNSLQAIRPRLEDIIANEDALVKGIRVFDIPGSDIEAIQPF